jgi:hypothetical protein
VSDAPPATARARHSLIRLLLVLAGAVSIGILLWTLDRPLTDQHGFRQTQTAISVYWMLHGAGWVDYQTPVLGAPWTAPFEFPLYQWLVAGLVRATGIGLDPAGRLVSYGWLIAGLWPATWLARSYRLPPATAPLYALLLLASPVYLFWARAFLMETQAVTLGIAMLAFYRTWLVGRKPVFWALACLSCAGAALTKITTLAPFLLLAAVMMAATLLGEERRLPRWLATLAGSAAAMLPGLALFLIWTEHADALKSANPLSAYLLSSPLNGWTFGTLGQRFSPDLAVALYRGALDVAGWLAPLAVLGSAYALWKLRVGERRPAVVAGVLFAAWLTPFAIFTNLHIVHNYYQAGNAVFLIGALAVVLAAILRHVSRLAAASLLAALLLSQYVRFAEAFAPSLITGRSQHDLIIGMTLRDAVPPGSAIIGIGLDWSPVVPYYAQRKALLIPAFGAVHAESLIADLPRYLGGLPLGAVVTCPSALQQDRRFMARLRALTSSFDARRLGDCMLYTAPVGAPHFDPEAG